jgi:hypothetical protein
MQIEFKNFPINWVDGMKITSKDFIALDNYLQDTVRDTRAQDLHSFKYGLVDSSNHEVDRYPKFQINYAQSSLVLVECRAITPGGFRIEISERTFESAAFPSQYPSFKITPDLYGIFEVFLLIKDFERVGAGRFAEDLPPRQKSISPVYELHLQRRGEGAFIGELPNMLKISEIEFRDGKVTEVFTDTGRYYPPVMSIKAHRKLEEKYLEFEQSLSNILEQAKTLLLEVSPYSDVNQDAKDALSVAEKVAAYVMSNLSHFRFIIPQQPPIYMISYFYDMARYLRFSVELCFRGNLVKNSYNQFGVSQNVDFLISATPNHANLYPTIMAIDNFLKVLEQLFNALRQNQYRTVYVRVEDQNRITELLDRGINPNAVPVFVPPSGPTHLNTPPQQQQMPQQPFYPPAPQNTPPIQQPQQPQETPRPQGPERPF